MDFTTMDIIQITLLILILVSVNRPLLKKLRLIGKRTIVVSSPLFGKAGS